MEENELIFIREENPTSDRTIKFFYDQVKDVVVINDSNYPSQKVEKKFSKRKGKPDAVDYRVRLNPSGSLRKMWVISRNCIFHLNSFEKERISSRWNLKAYFFDRDLVKDYLKKTYLTHGMQIPSFTLLANSDSNSPEKAIRNWCYKDGNYGSSTYYEILDELGVNSDVIYRTHEGKTLRSYAEFVLFSFLHFNNIEFEYELENLGGCVPDFKLSNNTYIELVGYDENSNSEHAIKYHYRLSDKKQKYTKMGLNIFYLDITESVNPKDSVYSQIRQLFPDILVPNIFQYFEKFAFSGKKYVEHLKELGRKFAQGSINSQELQKSYQPDYMKILHEYSSVYDFCETYMTFEELINTPKSSGYFYHLPNCYKWLDFLVQKSEKLPSRSDCKNGGEFGPLYSIYRVYGSNEFCWGGLFENYPTPYKKKIKENFEVINTQTQEIFSGIYDAYIKTKQIITVGEFYNNIARNESDFICNSRSGIRIKNTITNNIYKSIKECAVKENINFSSFDQYIRKLRLGGVLKSKFSHLVPLTADYLPIDKENYLALRYESYLIYNDIEIQIIHELVKKSHTEKEISKTINKPFARRVFYKSPLYQKKIKEFFNEELNHKNINQVYPPKIMRTNFTLQEIKQILSFSYSDAKKKFGIKTGTYYNIKNKTGKYSLMDY